LFSMMVKENYTANMHWTLHKHRFRVCVLM
jgi:hypothetical protein